MFVLSQARLAESLMGPILSFLRGRRPLEQTNKQMSVKNTKKLALYKRFLSYRWLCYDTTDMRLLYGKQHLAEWKNI